MPSHATRMLTAISLALVVLLVISDYAPYDRMTWAMEVVPIVIALPVLWATRRRFPLTDLLYLCILVHGCVLILGGTYTYERVPLGYHIQSWLSLSRNPYDKIGHFFQGFVPALVTREILIRGHYVRGRKMLAFLVVCVVMAISASYELIEWGAALALGKSADAFLGTQGYAWDTQSDMLFALIGAVAALALMSRIHDRQIARLSAAHKA